MSVAHDVVDAPLAEVREAFARVSTAQMADAAGQLVQRVDRPFVARNGRPRVCGPAFPVETDDDMLPCLQALAAVPRGHVLVIVNRTSPSEALVGDIYLTSALVQGVAGVVVDGAVRDLEDLQEIDVPVFSTEVTFASARTTDRRADAVPATVSLGGADIAPGDWICGDLDGFLVAPAREVRAVMLAAAILREREEALRATIRGTGSTLAELTNLESYLRGEAPLGFVP